MTYVRYVKELATHTFLCVFKTFLDNLPLPRVLFTYSVIHRHAKNQEHAQTHTYTYIHTIPMQVIFK